MYKNPGTIWDHLPRPSSWKSALLDIIKQPGSYRPIIYDSNDDCIAIYDRYPKSQRHLLILPRSPTPSIHQLTIEHIPILYRVIEFANHVADRLVESGSVQPGRYKYGFHAIPSLDQLHLHLISTDMDSAYIKNKKHWNSFCTNFFLSPEYVLKEIQSKGKLDIDPTYYNSLLEKPLACHKCGQTQPNLPKLKNHIRSCSM